jgi:hypothetical protein
MSNERKKIYVNDRVNEAKERKLWVEENKRICKMEREAEVAFMQKQKRYCVGDLAAKTAQAIFPVQLHTYSI